MLSLQRNCSAFAHEVCVNIHVINVARLQGTLFTTSAAPTSHSDSRTGTRKHACVLCASLSRALVKKTRREKEEWEEKVEEVRWKVL